MPKKDETQYLKILKNIVAESVLKNEDDGSNSFCELEPGRSTITKYN